MAVRAIGGEQLRAGLVLIEILRLRRSDRQRPIMMMSEGNPRLTANIARTSRRMFRSGSIACRLAMN